MCVDSRATGRKVRKERDTQSFSVIRGSGKHSPKSPIPAPLSPGSDWGRSIAHRKSATNSIDLILIQSRPLQTRRMNGESCPGSGDWDSNSSDRSRPPAETRAKTPRRKVVNDRTAGKEQAAAGSRRTFQNQVMDKGTSKLTDRTSGIRSQEQRLLSLDRIFAGGVEQCLHFHRMIHVITVRNVCVPLLSGKQHNDQ